MTISDAQAEVSARGAETLKPMTREELLFARGLFAATPPVSPYPPGEDAMIAMFPDGGAAVVFVMGGKACGRMAVSPTMARLLFDIDKSI